MEARATFGPLASVYLLRIEQANCIQSSVELILYALKPCCGLCGSVSPERSEPSGLENWAGDTSDITQGSSHDSQQSHSRQDNSDRVADLIQHLMLPGPIQTLAAAPEDGAGAGAEQPTRSDAAGGGATQQALSVEAEKPAPSPVSSSAQPSSHLRGST